VNPATPFGGGGAGLLWLHYGFYLSQVSFSHGISFEGDFIGVVKQAVQDGVCEGWVAYEVMPVVHRELAGHEGRSNAMTILCDFEEVVTLFIVECEEAPVVEDEEVGLGKGGKEPAISAIAFGDVKFWEKPWQADVLGGVALPAGLMSEGAGEVGFAASGRAGDDEVMVLWDKGAGGELCHEGFVESSGMAVINVLDRGLLSESGLFEAAFETAILSFCDLAVDHQA
jgi:hypothetical protein